MQAKVKLRPPPEEHDLHRTPSKRFSLQYSHKTRPSAHASTVQADGEIHTKYVESMLFTLLEWIY